MNNHIKLYTVLFIVCLIAVFTSSCNGPSTRNQSLNANDTTHIEQFFHAFISKHPNGLNNDVLKEQMNKVFRNEIIDSLSKSSWLLEDYPIRLEQFKSLGNNKYSVHLQSWLHPDNFSFKDYDLHQLGFDIVGTTDSSYVNRLVEGNYYYIHGKLIRFISHQEFGYYTDHPAFTPSVGISKEIGSSTQLNMDMGEMLFEIDSLTNYQK